MSAISRGALDAARAAVGKGSPLATDPWLMGIPPSPFFAQKLRFTEVLDSQGRIRLAAFRSREND